MRNSNRISSIKLISHLVSISPCHYNLFAFLEVETDTSNGREFLKHEYNRDGDSYRSPWTNTYFPESPDSTFFPSEQLLKLEQKANDTFTTYVKLYYDNAFTSCYFNDTEEPGFKAAFLVKKEMDQTAGITKGTWDAIHIVVCKLKDAGKAAYTVISTAMVSLEVQTQSIGKMVLTGSTSKNAKEMVNIPEKLGQAGELDFETFHISNIGTLIEQNEDKLRSEVSQLYINKQRQITNTGRLLEHYITKDE